MEYMNYIDLPKHLNHINYIDYPKYSNYQKYLNYKNHIYPKYSNYQKYLNYKNHIDYPKYMFDFDNRDDTNIHLPDYDLREILKYLNKIYNDKSNEQILTEPPHTEPHHTNTPQTESPHTDKYNFSLNDAYNQFDTFMEKEKEDTIKNLRSTNYYNKIEKEIINNTNNFNYQELKKRYDELKYIWSEICNKSDSVIDFTTEEESKIKKELIELEYFILNLDDN